ncbi:hypothetical protein BpHYR1_029757 [Brachionus plicatilis]|uniref:Uncharacterized protein n=1 Tax=Brachionus plicatilis TaxID=10195 RepID=A0A3M7PGH4_BRAPC|nr:hypothetical protein BpHYR1_029757 [Brachionus plicatilis]
MELLKLNKNSSKPEAGSNSRLNAKSSHSPMTISAVVKTFISPNTCPPRTWPFLVESEMCRWWPPMQERTKFTSFSSCPPKAMRTVAFVRLPTQVIIKADLRPFCLTKLSNSWFKSWLGLKRKAYTFNRKQVKF